MRTLACLLIAGAAWAAPVPKTGKVPDPLGKGYMGVYAVTDRGTGDATLVIERVIPNSAAAVCGLQAGDKFVRVGPLTPTSFDDIRNLIGFLRPGTKIDLVILRTGRETAKTITLGERPPDFERGVIIEP